MKSFSYALVLLLLGVPALARADEKPVKPIVVPFEVLKSGHMAIMVKVNGKGPYKVIFDTGAPINLLNNKVAKAADLLKNAKKPLFNLFGTMGQVSVKTLEVGDLKVEEVNTIVMDHPTVEAISKALGPIEGIVGFPFFARFKMTLDYQAKELTFVPNGFKPPDVMQSMMASLMAGANGKADGPKILAPAGLWGISATKDKDNEDAGVVVKEVLPGSAAEAGGLKVGDRLLSIDGRWTDTLPDLFTASGFVKAGTEVKVMILRDGKEQELRIKPTAGL